MNITVFDLLNLGGNIESQYFQNVFQKLIQKNIT